MKKIKLLTAVLCSVAVLSILVGCGNTVQNETTLVEDATEVPQQPAVKSEAELFYDTLTEYIETHNSPFSIVEGTFVYKTSFNDYFTYEFDILDENADHSTDARSVSFKAQQDGTSEKSFSIFFSSAKDGHLIKEFIVSFLSITNPMLSEAECREKMQTFVDSYATDKLSEYLDNGDCVLLLEPYSFEEQIGLNSHLYVIYKDEAPQIPASIDKQSYSELKYESALSEINKGDKVVFVATVKESRFDDCLFPGYRSSYLVCEMNDGQKIFVIYSAHERIKPFVSDRAYMIYGHIAMPSDGIPCITMHGAEETE